MPKSMFAPMQRQFSFDNFASGSNANYMESMHEQWE
jgi:hypothetical protein